LTSRTFVPVEHLRAKYIELSSTGFLGGSSFLYELERYAWTSFEGEHHTRRLTAFVLANVLNGLAKRQETAGAVTADYCGKLHAALDQHIMVCIDILAGRATTTNELKAVTDLLGSYARVRHWDPAV
jgi:hypothetical protein